MELNPKQNAIENALSFKECCFLQLDQSFAIFEKQVEHVCAVRSTNNFDFLVLLQEF